MPTPLIRDMRAGARLQTFLVSAIASVLCVRLFLELAGYPQLAPGGLHIAHMLWGGILMLAAIVILLSFVGKGVARLAAVVGGVGFGMFIDEVGKFVTRDNDYFYRPAVAIIYVIFVLLYLAIRAIHRARAYSQTEYLVNALVHMEDVALHDLDEEEAKRVRAFLDKSDPSHPLVEPLTRTIHGAKLVPRPVPSLPERAGRWIVEKYRDVTRQPNFPSAIVGIFIAMLLAKAIYIVFIIFFAGLGWQRWGPFDGSAGLSVRAVTVSFVQWAELGSWVLSALFVARGIFLMRRSRIRAFRMFESSVLVTIFITHVFSFYKEQFVALIGLAFSILMLISLRFMIQQERVRALPPR